MVPWRFVLPVLCLGLLLTAAPASRSADWPQLRGDPLRSGASPDKTYGPLTEIWSWPDFRVDVPSLQRGVLNRASLRHGLTQVLVWNDRAYFVTARVQQPQTRTLLCTNARTGEILWTRDLGVVRALYGYGPPAISINGTLFAYDIAPNPGVPARLEDRDLDERVFVRAISALDGRILTSHFDPGIHPSIDTKALFLPEPLRDNITLSHLPPGELVEYARRVPMDPGIEGVRIGEYYGCPLLLGEDLIALTTGSGILRWRPFQFEQFLTFQHAIGEDSRRIAAPPAAFAGVVPVALPGSGVVIGGGGTNPFLALFDFGRSGGLYTRWHRDLPYVMGIPVAAGRSIVVGLGRPGGTHALLALDVTSGETRWTYAPLGPVTANETESVSRNGITRFSSTLPYPDSPGIVARQGLVYAVVAGGLTALDQASGKVVWRTPVDPSWLPRSLVASSTHLFLSVGLIPNKVQDDRAALLVYDLKDGKPLWKLPTREFGSISLANGLVYLADHGFVHTYAPAERTFRLAVDSDLPEDYQAPPPPQEEGATDGGGNGGTSPTPEASPAAAGGEKAGESTGDFEPAAPPTPALADATILRLEWRTGPEAMLARVRERRKAAPRSPLVLNWLDPTRSGLAGGSAGQLPPLEQFTETCARLAAIARPNYFEVVSDTNAFLSRYPSRIEAVVELVRQASAAISGASGGTFVTISYNAELLSGQYGLGSYLPFGRIARPTRENAARILALAGMVDTLALTTYPRSAFRVHSGMPYTHLLQVRRLFPEHRLLITEIGLPLNEKLPNREEDQARFLSRLLCACYWLDTNVVAFPRLTAGPRDTDIDFALRVGKTERVALAEWRRVLGWKRVARLSVGGPGKLPIPDADAVGIEGAEREGVLNGKEPAPQ